MKLEEELRLYKESRSIQAREICRKRTIEQSKKVFYAEADFIGNRISIYPAWIYPKTMVDVTGPASDKSVEFSFLYKRAVLRTAKYGSGGGFVCDFADS